MSSKLQVDNVGNPYIDHTQEALVALLELALIEDLDSNNGRVLDISDAKDEMMQQEKGRCLHVKALVPVRVQRLLEDTGGVCLLRIYCYDSKRIWEAENLALRQAIRGHNCRQS